MSGVFSAQITIEIEIDPEAPKRPFVVFTVQFRTRGRNHLAIQVGRDTVAGAERGEFPHGARQEHVLCLARFELSVLQVNC